MSTVEIKNLRSSSFGTLKFISEYTFVPKLQMRLDCNSLVILIKRVMPLQFGDLNFPIGTKTRVSLLWDTRMLTGRVQEEIDSLQTEWCSIPGRASFRFYNISDFALDPDDLSLNSSMSGWGPGKNRRSWSTSLYERTWLLKSIQNLASPCGYRIIPISARASTETGLYNPSSMPRPSTLRYPTY